MANRIIFCCVESVVEVEDYQFLHQEEKIKENLIDDVISSCSYSRMKQCFETDQQIKFATF